MSNIVSVDAPGLAPTLVLGSPNYHRKARNRLGSRHSVHPHTAFLDLFGELNLEIRSVMPNSALLHPICALMRGSESNYYPGSGRFRPLPPAPERSDSDSDMDVKNQFQAQGTKKAIIFTNAGEEGLSRPSEPEQVRHLVRNVIKG